MRIPSDVGIGLGVNDAGPSYEAPVELAVFAAETGRNTDRIGLDGPESTGLADT